MASYVHRQLEPVLREVVAQFPAVAVSGPRQCGKSTLLKALFAKTHTYVSFDDPVVRERAIADPKLFLDGAGEQVVLDEIQYVPQLVLDVKVAIDADFPRRKGRFIFTGSQQFTLIKNLGDSLAGRIALLDLLPFHVDEKRAIPALRPTLSTTRGAFTHACLRGSYPEPVTDSALDFTTWYGSYLQTYLERDVRTLYDIGSLRDFQRFLQLLAARTAQLLHLTSLANDLGVSVNTVKRWLSVLEASRIIFLLPPYWRNVGQRVTKAPKVYFLDCGLVCYLVGLQDEAHLLQGPMAGALFETFCVQETVKRFLFQGQRPTLYYFRAHSGLEVDLILERGTALFPIEIKLTQTPTVAMAEPIRRFRQQLARWDVQEGRILCLSEESAPLARGVSVQAFDDYTRWLADTSSRRRR